MSNDHKELHAKVIEAAQALTWHPAGTGLGAEWVRKLAKHVRIVDPAEMPGGCTTACVDGQAVWFCAPFVRDLTLGQLVFLIAHEVSHVALGHLEHCVMLGIAHENPPKDDGSSGGYQILPGRERDSRLLGKAHDAYINHHLTTSKLGAMPPGGILPGNMHQIDEVEGAPPYAGKLTSEDMFKFLLAHAKAEDPNAPPPPGGGPGSAPATGGCEPIGLPGGLTDVDAQQMRANIREQAKGTGKGTAIADAFEPPKKLVDWRSIIRDAFETASLDAADRSERSYARASRRQIDPQIIMPGLVGTEANIAILIDVSGSVGGEWAAAAGAYTRALGTDFPEVKVRLITHTDSVTYSGMIMPETDLDEIKKAIGHTGGTDAQPGYDEMARTAPHAGWDVGVHFTDGDLPSNPVIPARRRIFGALCGAEIPNANGAKVIRCGL